MQKAETESYTFEEVLGEGSCGRVYRCGTPSGEMRAVKVMTAMAINRDLVRYALRRLADLPDHPGLVKVHYFELEETPYHYVMDLHADCVSSSGEGEEVWKSRRLDSVIGKVDREEAWRLIDQLAETLSFLHSNELFHCGLKPSNVLLTLEGGRSQTKIADLAQGWVSGAHYLELNDIPFFIPPEQLRTAEFLDGHGQRSDVYSFGVTAYLLLTGRLPRLEEWFAGKNANVKPWEASAAQSAFEFEEHAPHQFAEEIEAQREISWGTVEPRDALEAERFEVISRCLAIDVSERFSDMVEVVDSFRREGRARQVEAADLAPPRAGDQVKKRRANSIRPLPTALAALLVVSTIAGVVSYLMLQKTKEILARTERDFNATLAEKIEEVKMAMGKVARADEYVQTAKQREEAARAQLVETQQFGDDLYAFLTGYPDIEDQGYRRDRRKTLEQACRYYDEFIRNHEGNPLLHEMTVEARQRLTEAIREMGSLNELKKSLVDTGKAIEQLLESRPNDIYWSRKNAENLRALTGVYVEEARFDQARDAAAKSLAILEELAEQNPKSKPFRFQVAEALVVMAAVEKGAARDQEGLKLLERSVDITMPLHESDPNEPKYRLTLARSFGLMGDFMNALHDLDGGITMHEKCVEMLSQLVREHAGANNSTRQLAHSFLRLAEMKNSIEHGQDALVLLTALSEDAPEDGRLRQELADCYRILGELQRDQGQSKNAQELQNKALTMLEELVGRHASVEEYQLSYAECLHRQSGLAEDGNSYETSLGYLSVALGVVEKLAQKSPDNIRYQQKLAELRGSIGFANEMVGNKEGAKEGYSDALAQWERLARILPEDDVVERGLVWSKRQLAALAQ